MDGRRGECQPDSAQLGAKRRDRRKRRVIVAMVMANLANTGWDRGHDVMRVFRCMDVSECVRQLPGRPGTGGQHEQRNSPETQEGGAHRRKG